LKAKGKKSIGALERSSLPRGFISDWFDLLERVETPEQYLACLPAGSAGRKLATFWLGLDSPKGTGTDKEAEGRGTPDPGHTMSLWYFLGKLHAGLNSSADDLISRAQHRLDLTEVILQFKGMLRAFNPTARWRDTTAVGTFAALLVRARGNISSNLSELRSLALTCESISRSKYARGHNMLLKCFAAEAKKLHERTQECAQQYQHQLRELKSARGLSATEWPLELCEIDLEAIEELAVSESKMSSRKLIDVAEAEMSIAFDKIPKAFEILKPYLEGGGDPEQD